MTDSVTPALLRRERLLLVVSAVLMALLFLTTVGSISATVLALNARQDTVTRATNRITTLQHDLKNARAEIAVLKGQNAEANTKLDAIAEQLDRLGVEPIVNPAVGGGAADGRDARSATAATPAARPAPTATTTTTTTSTTSPPVPPSPAPSSPPAPDEPRPATPIPFPCSTVFVPVLCRQGA